MKFAGLLLLVSLAAAQSGLDRFNKTSFVTLQPTEEVRLKGGKPAKATIRFRVNPGYHVNSNKPASDLLIPTQINFEKQAGVTVGRLVYPAGEDLALAFSPKQKLSVYQGDVAVTVPLSATKTAKRGAYKLKGSLSYQACNDNACFPPKTTPFEVSVVIE